ncbi:AI-2E family transporter [Methylobrevis pamukkalensis]|nr:AI-2E family transporter [Methylobrevis pamukkalensis]
MDDAPRPGDTSEVPEADRLSLPEPFFSLEARVAQVGIFVIMFAAALYIARDFAMPVTFAFLLALVLSPIVRRMRRIGIPEVLSAAALVVLFLATLGTMVWFLADPVQRWIADAPQFAAEFRDKLTLFRGPVDQVLEASKRIEESATAGVPAPQRVVVEQGGFISEAVVGVPLIFAKIALCVVLLFFLLASGDMFYEKLVKVLPTLSDKKRGVRIAREIEREISHYLLTVTVINAGLGVALGLAMWAVGLPNPFLWGLVGGLLNFLPYVGAFLSAALVAAVSFVSFNTVGEILLAPGVYYLVNAFEGQVITPALVGRRLEMNPVAVFVAVAFWGWIWGIAGAIMAVPLLVIVKTVADYIDGYAALGEFLTARTTEEKD